MGFYALTALINAVTSTVVGLLAYFGYRKSIVAKRFAFFCMSIAIFSYAYFLWQISSTVPSALFWSRTLMAAAIYIPILFFHFVLSFIKKIKEYKKYLIFGYFVFSFFFVANFTPYFVKSVSPKPPFDFWGNPGILYHPFLVAWFFYALASLYLLWREIPDAKGVYQSQLKYLFTGTLIGFLGGSTNYFLWYDIPIPPIGNWTIAFYLGIVAYAIVRKELFGVKIVLTQFLVAIFAAFLLVQIFLSNTTPEYIWSGTLFAASLFIGYLLIKEIFKEIKDKERIEELGRKLVETEKKLAEDHRYVAAEVTKRLERTHSDLWRRDDEVDRLKFRIRELEDELEKKV